MSKKSEISNKEVITDMTLSWIEFDENAGVVSTSCDLVEHLSFQTRLASLTHPNEVGRLNRALQKHGVYVKEFGATGVSTEIILPGAKADDDSEEELGPKVVTPNLHGHEIKNGVERIGRFHLRFFAGTDIWRPYELLANYVNSAVPTLRFQATIAQPELLSPDSAVDVETEVESPPGPETVSAVTSVPKSESSTDSDTDSSSVTERAVGDKTALEPETERQIVAPESEAQILEPEAEAEILEPASESEPESEPKAETLFSSQDAEAGDEVVDDVEAGSELTDDARVGTEVAEGVEVGTRVDNEVTSSTLSATWAGISSKLQRWHIQDILAIVVVTAVAAWLRMRSLATFPPGFHGDEAIAGDEMARVLREGWIGIYSPSALGQPAIPFYFGAPIIALFGLTMESVRLVAAVGGTLAVVAAYLLVRRFFGTVSAVASALALALIPIGLHFSRVGFPIAWWPLSFILTLIPLGYAEVKRSWKLWAITGFMAGFGVYVYNAHWMWGAAMAIFVLLRLIFGSDRLKVLAVALGAAVSVGPMAIHLQSGERTNHFKLVTRTNSPEWEGRTFSSLADETFTTYKQVWKFLTGSTHINGIDGAGASPMIPKLYLAIAGFGLLAAVVNFLRLRAGSKTETDELLETDELPATDELLETDELPATGAVSMAQKSIIGLLVLTVLVTPIGAALTDNGEIRRSYLSGVAIALLAGIGVDYLLKAVGSLTNKKSSNLNAVQIVVMVVLAAAALLTSRTYMKEHAKHPAVQWVFASELAHSDQQVTAIIEEDGNQRPVWVNWYSGRHHFGYETLVFLRGDRYEGSTNVELGHMPEVIDWHTKAPEGYLSVYVLHGDYANRVAELQELYPEAQIFSNSMTPRTTVVKLAN